MRTHTGAVRAVAGGSTKEETKIKRIGVNMKNKIAVLFFLGCALSQAATLNLTNLPPIFDNGAFVGPSTGNIDGGPSFQLECIDYFVNTPIPSSFEVNITLYNSVASPLLYKEIDFLLRQQTAATIAQTQWVIWNLVFPATPDHHGSDTVIATLGAIDFSNYTPDLLLYSDVRNTSKDWFNQNFVQAIPEPSTYAFVGLALLGLGFMRRRQAQ